jgi:hypothetical protein
MSPASRTQATAFGRTEAAIPPYSKSATPGPAWSGLSKAISNAVSIKGARSGVQRLGCKQPVGVVEAPIPHPSRPAGRIQQGAQVTKPISPVRIGKLGGGHAAVVREIAVPKGDCGKDTGYGERVESAKDRAAKIADPAQSD